MLLYIGFILLCKIKHLDIKIKDFYMYGFDNAKHYDYFDYIDDNKNIVQYEPDSDSDFVKFKEIMKKEWNNVSKNSY